jgi:H+-translocating NAD(P) transhydrogenase subunit alpha
MQVVVPKEVRPGETRVAIVPESAAKLVGGGLTVIVEQGAGEAAGFSDSTYVDVGATIAPELDLAAADLILKVRPPLHEGASSEVTRMRPGATLIGFLEPLTTPALLKALAEQRVTTFSMELVPRITRAQRMDALSSQATVAGYKAALLAASSTTRFFPMLMTAAGTVPPGKVLVIGAGVAGLQAIATARRLGAVVQGFDIRPAVKEQVESLGATWVGLEMAEAEGAGGYAKEVSEDAQKREHEHLHKLAAEVDVVITTAQIPGRKAPVLLTDDMLADMRPGSVIIDLAAESGGNCTRTRVDEVVHHNGVTILGPSNLPGTLPFHASQMYSRNVLALAQHLVSEGALKLDLDDEITRECLVTHDGEVVHARARTVLAGATG